jgi:hypothetical protein
MLYREVRKYHMRRSCGHEKGTILGLYTKERDRCSHGRAGVDGTMMTFAYQSRLRVLVAAYLGCEFFCGVGEGMTTSSLLRFSTSK